MYLYYKCKAIIIQLFSPWFVSSRNNKKVSPAATRQISAAQTRCYRKCFTCGFAEIVCFNFGNIIPIHAGVSEISNWRWSLTVMLRKTIHFLVPPKLKNLLRIMFLTFAHCITNKPPFIYLQKMGLYWFRQQSSL